MTANETQSSDHSVQVGGDIACSAVTTGDNNNISVQFQQMSLPESEKVNIRAELKALQAIFASFNDPIATGVAQKLGQEATKPEPDKSSVATTLETGLTYSQSLAGFTEAINRLRPHVEATAGWLGKHCHKLLLLLV